MCHGSFVTAQDADDLPASPTPTTQAASQPTTRPALTGPHAASLTYQFLQRRIMTRQANVAEDLLGFHFIIQDLVDYDNIKLALQAATKEPTPERYNELYAHFSRATPIPDVVLQYLDVALARDIERGLATPDDAAQFYAWPAANGLTALVEAFDATQDVRFLELFIRTYDEILKARDSEHKRRDEVRDRVMKTWGYRHRERWTCVMTHAGRIGYPVLRFCLAVDRADKKVRRQFNAKAQEYLNSIKTAIREFDDDFRVIPGTNEGYYVRASIGDVEPLNHMHAVGNSLVLLHVLTGKEEYKTRAEQLANYFRGSAERHDNGSLTWGLQPTPEQRTGHAPELMWKGEVTIGFPVTGLRHSIGFTRDDLLPIVNTFMKNVWRGNGVINTSTSPGLDEELKLFDFTGWELRTASFLGWVRLDSVDPRVREAVEQAMISRTDLYPQGWLQNTKTIEIYAYRMKPPAAAEQSGAAAK